MMGGLPAWRFLPTSPFTRPWNGPRATTLVTVKSARSKVTALSRFTALTGTRPAHWFQSRKLQIRIPPCGAADFIQVLYVCLVYGPIAAYLIEASRRRSLHFAFTPLSHRERSVWRVVALIGVAVVRPKLAIVYAGSITDDRGRHTFVVGSLLLKRDPPATAFGMKPEEKHRRRLAVPIPLDSASRFSSALSRALSPGCTSNASRALLCQSGERSENAAQRNN